MTDGQGKAARAAEEHRPIPDERDQMIRPQPQRPDLRCEEHGGICEILHSLHNRVVMLEQRVKMVEDRKQFPPAA